ncbi:MAG: hypothetical protein H6531_07125 [Actinobacteria bacterium]|nr:hypothetical protein [Actinomycetota bacterium]
MTDAYRGWRAGWHRLSTRVYGPSRGLEGFNWVPGEPIAIGSLPVGDAVTRLPGHGITHSVVCRAALQTSISQDLWAERAVLGEGNVAHAPMWDRGRNQPEALWVPAVRFAAQALRDDPDARVLIHCQQGRRRSVMVAYATLRLRGHSADDAARLVLETRPMGRLVPVYRANVENWLQTLADGADVAAGA